MTYGHGLGFGRTQGAGFGFRGTSPAWPYVGRGRGGLPRCSYYFGSGAPATPELAGDDEIAFLKAQSHELSQRLAEIDARMKELESKRSG